MDDQRQRQIIAIGGLSAVSGPKIFRYLLQQTTAQCPRVGFLPTASADSEVMIDLFYKGFAPFSCTASHLSLFGRVSDPAEFVHDNDIILVGGGNTKSMLGLWREWAIDEMLRDAWEAGTVLSGFSAGAICWFAEGLSDSWADRLAPTTGLGLLSGSCCPHYDGEAERRPVYHQLILDAAILPGVAIDDDCAVHFEGTVPKCVVAAGVGTGAYSIIDRDGSIEETPLGVKIRKLEAA